MQTPHQKIRNYLYAIGHTIAEANLHATELTKLLLSQDSHSDNIIARYCSIYGITEDEIKSSARPRHIVIPRQLCMVALLKTGLTLESVGMLFNRHHSTVLYSKRIVESMIDVKDEVYMEYIERLSGSDKAIEIRINGLAIDSPQSTGVDKLTK